MTYTYTEEQLEELIQLAVEQATAPLEEELWKLRATVEILKETPRDAA